MLDHSISRQMKESGFRVDRMLAVIYLSDCGKTGV